MQFIKELCFVFEVTSVEIGTPASIIHHGHILVSAESKNKALADVEYILQQEYEAHADEAFKKFTSDGSPVCSTQHLHSTFIGVVLPDSRQQSYHVKDGVIFTTAIQK